MAVMSMKGNNGVISLMAIMEYRENGVAGENNNEIW
jgi:hypothetical protein